MYVTNNTLGAINLPLSMHFIQVVFIDAPTDKSVTLYSFSLIQICILSTFEATFRYLHCNIIEGREGAYIGVVVESMDSTVVDDSDVVII